MSRFVRASKYRHVFGQPGKKEYGIENVKVSNSAWDTNLISASGEYLALNWNASGGGAFAILPLPSPFQPLPHNLHTKLPDIIPLARGHLAPVLDTAWSPFDDSVVASAGEDGRVFIWKVEPSQFEGWGEEHWEPTDFSPVARIQGSGRKIGQVLFHPTAQHVLATAVGDHTVRLWDLGSTDEPRATLAGHTDAIQALSFNATGTLLITTCRDRKLRLFDPRAGGDPVRVSDGHAGIKGARVVWMGDDDKFATTGFSKMSDRQVGIWEAGNLSNIKMTAIDQSAGVLMPFWSDNNILFLAGKGDGNIRYYEHEGGNLFPLSEYKSSEPQRGMTFLPRRALNASENEIARVYKVHSAGVEPIAFIVPRKAEAFQADIFPPAPAAEPSLTAGEFFTGKPVVLKLVNLGDGSISTVKTESPTHASPQSQVKAPQRATSVPVAASPAGTPIKTSMSQPAPSVVPPKVDVPALATTAIVVSPSPTMIEVGRHDSFRILTPKPEANGPISPDIEVSEPAIRMLPTESTAQVSAISGGKPDLLKENARLERELEVARNHIRELQIQIDSMKEAQKAARALLV